MRQVIFADGVKGDIKKIPPKVRARIFAKIKYFSSLSDPRSVASPMIDFYAGNWRRRIGDYRVIFDIDDIGRIIVVLIVRHRSTIYK